MSRPDARAAVLSDYVHFLTTPGTHRDTYAESFHRSFFSDWQQDRPTAGREVSAAVTLFIVAVLPFDTLLLTLSPSGSHVCGEAFQTPVGFEVL